MIAETQSMVRCADCRFLSGKRGSWCSRAQKHATEAHWRRCDQFRAPNDGDGSVRDDEVAVPLQKIEVPKHHVAGASERDTRAHLQMAKEREVQTEPDPERATANSVAAIRQMAGVQVCEIRADTVIVRFHRYATSEQRTDVDRMFPESGTVRRRRATMARPKNRG